MNCCSGKKHSRSGEKNSPPSAIKWFSISVFAIGGGYYLWTQHKAHILQFLPFFVFLLCPLMHLFHGHGNHSGNDHHEGHDDGHKQTENKKLN